MVFSEINLLSLASGADWRVWLLQAHPGAAEEAVWGALEEAHPFLCWCQDWEGMWGACSTHICTVKYAVPHVLEFSIWWTGRSIMDLTWPLKKTLSVSFCLEAESSVGSGSERLVFRSFSIGQGVSTQAWIAGNEDSGAHWEQYQWAGKTLLSSHWLDHLKAASENPGYAVQPLALAWAQQAEERVRWAGSWEQPAKSTIKAHGLTSPKHNSPIWHFSWALRILNKLQSVYP